MSASTSPPDGYDAVVIGTGQAGKPLAVDLAKAGHRTAIIEREHVGGTCVNVGCTPTKTMVASARVAYLAQRGGDYGVQVGSIDIDMSKVRQRKRDIVERFSSGIRKQLEKTEGVDLIMGEASFIGPKAIGVALNEGGRREVAAQRVFINTGARPRVPDVAGLDGVPVLDSTSIMELDVVPEHLLILGGGYVGVEFGQMFRRFGSDVTVVQRRDQLLAGEDPDVAEGIAEILRDDGIEVLLETQAKRVEPDGAIRLVVETPDGQRTLAGSHLLVSAGRVPNTDRLNLEAASVEIDRRGFLPVNDKLETNVPGIYALGDVNGGPAFTHIAYDDYRIIRANLIEGGEANTGARYVPYTVFTDPELGRVGLTEKEAQGRGIDYRVAKMPMAHVARALETDESRGFMKALVDSESAQILGCAILGIQGGELASMLQIAMLGQLPYTELKEAIFSHPTLSEAFNNLFTHGFSE